MSVHSLGPLLLAHPPERICSKLVVQNPGVCNQPHLMISEKARSVRERSPAIRASLTSREYMQFTVLRQVGLMCFFCALLWISDRLWKWVRGRNSRQRMKILGSNTE